MIYKSCIEMHIGYDTLRAKAIWFVSSTKNGTSHFKWSQKLSSPKWSDWFDATAGYTNFKRGFVKTEWSDLDNWCGEQARVNKLEGFSCWSASNNSSTPYMSGSRDGFTPIEFPGDFSQAGRLAPTKISVNIDQILCQLFLDKFK